MTRNRDPATALADTFGSRPDDFVRLGRLLWDPIGRATTNRTSPPAAGPGHRPSLPPRRSGRRGRSMRWTSPRPSWSGSASAPTTSPS
jgi:hypothetical protein